MSVRLEMRAGASCVAGCQVEMRIRESRGSNDAMTGYAEGREVDNVACAVQSRDCWGLAAWIVL
jgi:hypothetical protein